MTREREVTLTIKVKTALPVKELQDLNTMVFGAMRSDSDESKRRAVIKKEPPPRRRADFFGLIQSVKVKAAR